MLYRSYRFVTSLWQVKVLQGEGSRTGRSPAVALLFTKYCFGLDQGAAGATSLRLSNAFPACCPNSPHDGRGHCCYPHKEHINTTLFETFITLPLFHETERGS
jgi:hypothetical protein